MRNNLPPLNRFPKIYIWIIKSLALIYTLIIFPLNVHNGKGWLNLSIIQNSEISLSKEGEKNRLFHIVHCHVLLMWLRKH